MNNISFLVPLYNRQDHIIRLLDSLKEALLPDDEIIVWDDGSTDEGLKRCQDYAKSHSAVQVFSAANRGSYLARVELLKRAAKDWVQFLDSDDTIDGTLYAEFRKKAMAKQADEAIFDCILTDQNGRELNYWRSFGNSLHEGNISKEEYQRAFFTTLYLNSLCSKLVRRSCFDIAAIEAQSNSRVIRNDDDRICSLCLLEKANSFWYYPKPIYHYQQTEGSQIRSRKKSDIDDCLFSIAISLDFIKRHELTLERDYASAIGFPELSYAIATAYFLSKTKKDFLVFREAIMSSRGYSSLTALKQGLLLRAKDKLYLRWLQKKRFGITAKVIRIHLMSH